MCLTDVILVSRIVEVICHVSKSLGWGFDHRASEYEAGVNHWAITLFDVFIQKCTDHLTVTAIEVFIEMYWSVKMFTFKLETEIITKMALMPDFLIINFNMFICFYLGDCQSLPSFYLLTLHWIVLRKVTYSTNTCQLFFYVHVTVHHNKFLYNKTNQMH